MRLVFDLFACQTASRMRGIGRYNDSLAAAMARLRGDHRLIALANGTGAYRDSAEALRQRFHTRVLAGDFACYAYPARQAFGADAHAFDTIASTVVQQAWQAAQPDAILSHPFEGWGEIGVAPPPPAHSSALQVALLYDFIPWLFAAQYLQDAAYKKWYLARLQALSRYDLLLAISEATRADAIRILGIAPDRVVNISGAVSAHFQPDARLPTAQFGISRRFVLYTGNVDYRKNMDGMLAAYALLPSALRATHQLVLNQVGDQAAFRRKTAALGLRDDEVIATGHISDADLIRLYSHCTLFVFPSLYEGFGLPILEAMSCGAPVLAADNSSMPELVGRADMLFDATDPRRIADAIQHALTDRAFRAEIAAYGRTRAKHFSWARCAELAWRALERATPHARVPSRARIAVVVAHGASEDPITRRFRQLLALLGAHLDLDLYTDHIEAHPLPNLHQHAVMNLLTRRHQYATVLWHFADNAAHAFMLPLMQTWPGLVVTDRDRCTAALQALDQQPMHHGAWHAEILHQYGLQGVLQLTDAAPPLALPHAGVTLILSQAESNDLTVDAARCLTALQRAIADDNQRAVEEIADALATSSPPDASRTETTGDIASYLASNAALAHKPRLLVDVTQLARTDAMSGIQRVVKQVARGLCAPGACARPVELVERIDGQLQRARHVIASLFALDAACLPRQPLAIHPGDTLLMIDSSWQQYAEFVPIFNVLRRRGGQIVTVVYDLIPLQRPELFEAPLVAVFERWIALALEHSDTLLCISRAVADDVNAWISTQKSVRPRPVSVRSWPLGADLPATVTPGIVRAAVQQLAESTQTPLLLMVGTVEPRKNHGFVLDALELLWSKGVALKLVIAGQAGWQVAEFMQRVRSHPEFGRKLFFVEKFTDAEIRICYRAATALIAASVAEGFGLPIVEAALYGVPVLASDIAVFREVGGAGATYFSLASPACLAAAITGLLTRAPAERQAMTARIPTVSWAQSVQALLREIGVAPIAEEKSANRD